MLVCCTTMSHVGFWHVWAQDLISQFDTHCHNLVQTTCSVSISMLRVCVISRPCVKGLPRKGRIECTLDDMSNRTTQTQPRLVLIQL